MNDKKYLIFSPYKSGLGNVLMSLEIGFALAHAMNRSLILPPTLHLTHISQGNKEQWPSIWQIFDYPVVSSLFDIAVTDFIPEFANYTDKLGNYQSWFMDAQHHIDDVYVFPELPAPPNDSVVTSEYCFVNNPNYYDDDFRKFSSNRSIIDINRPEKFVYIENTPFQHYWYWVYPGSSQERNIVKRKVNSALRYKKEYYDKVQEAVLNKIPKFNAVHIRRNDFFIQFGGALESIDSGQKILEKLLLQFDTSLPLFIATDETLREFFDPIRQRYAVFFIEDFFVPMGNLEQAILEQIICSHAKTFLGTWLSTYTKRINVMRGIDGLSAKDYEGINASTDVNYDLTDPLPWIKWPNGRWEWSSSSHPQWTYENVS